MDKLLTSTEIAGILDCSRDQALKLMYKMPHINVSSGRTRSNLRVWEKDFKHWLDGRTTQPLPIRRPGRKPKNTATKPVPIVHYKDKGMEDTA